MVLLQPPWFGELTLNLGLTFRLRKGLGRRTDGRILANSVAVAGVGVPRDVFKRDESWGRLRRNVRGGGAGNPRQRPQRGRNREWPEGSRGRSRTFARADRY